MNNFKNWPRGHCQIVKVKNWLNFQIKVDPLEIIDRGLISGMNVVGTRFKNGEMFVPEVLMAAGHEQGWNWSNLCWRVDLPSAGKWFGDGQGVARHWQKVNDDGERRLDGG